MGVNNSKITEVKDFTEDETNKIMNKLQNHIKQQNQQNQLIKKNDKLIKQQIKHYDSIEKTLTEKIKKQDKLIQENKTISTLTKNKTNILLHGINQLNDIKRNSITENYTRNNQQIFLNSEQFNSKFIMY